MPDISAPAELLRDLAVVLSRWGGRWFLFGAQAVNVWGSPRLTADVDVTVLLTPRDPAAFVHDMDLSEFGLRVDDVEDFVARTSVLPFVHRRTRMPLDVVLAGSGLEEQFADRARQVDVGGIEVPVLSPGDLLVAKILAGRPKDLEDAAGVLRARRGSLDLVLVRSLLGELEEALGQGDLLSALEGLLAGAEGSRRARRRTTRLQG